VAASAAAAAAALGIAKKTPPDPRIDLYEGASMGCRLFVATHAGVAPGPAFAFQREPVVAILAYFPEPLRGLALTTVHMAPRAAQTGDVAFDQWFKLQAGDAQLLAPAHLRQALMALYAGDPGGSGILIDVDAERVQVRCSEPRPQRTAQAARAALAAAVKLGQRAAFLR
jgi:hypothetical protein